MIKKSLLPRILVPNKNIHCWSFLLKNPDPAHLCSRDERGAGSESDFDLFWPDRFGTGLGFSTGPDRSWIV